jgi:hypothetical protein
MKLTNEQQNILNLIKNGEKFLKIIAFARKAQILG